VQIVNLLIEDITRFVLSKSKWARENEYIIRAIIKLFAGANHVEKYADKIFTGVQAELAK